MIRPMPKREYTFKGYMPYGAGELEVLDVYVDPYFSGNVPEEIMKDGGSWDEASMIMTMPSGVKVNFVPIP